MKSFAFVFPGQGSQSMGMLDGWREEPVVKHAVQEASSALGEDLGLLIKDGPKEALALTTNTQPVMLLAGIVAFRVWKEHGGHLPVVMAGHSLGEYAALVCADVLSLSDAIQLVRFRAAAMQEAVPVGQGAMSAVLNLSSAKIIQACLEVTQSFGSASQEVVQAANFNDPMQTVIAGSKAAVDKAGEALKAMGAKRVLPLPVSAPFHSTLMKPAADRLLQKMSELQFQSPTISVINNIDVLIQKDTNAIQDALYRQAFGPVRWVECVQAIQAQGVTAIIESGPGKVLTGMTKRIAPDLVSDALFDVDSLSEVTTLLN